LRHRNAIENLDSEFRKENFMTKQIVRATTTTLCGALLFLLCGGDRAQAAGPWHVSTTGNDANNCLSPATACLTIQAAVNKASNGDTINVAAGNYAGALNMLQRENLTITGASGAAISDPGLPPGAAVVSLNLTKNITLQGFTFSGNPNGVEAIRIFESLGISVNRSTIEGANLGFFINHSGVVIRDCTIQDNGIGIRVDGGSTVTLTSAPFSTGTSTVQRNGTGIVVRAGTFGLLGACIVQDNNVGISGHGGVIKVCCQDGTRKINNNGTGILLQGDNLELRGPLEMEGNRLFAIRMFGSFATVSDRIIIRHNGTPDTAAIAVTGGHLQLNGRQASDIVISDNPGIGLFLTDNASARVLNAQISDNGGHGMRLQALASAQLLAAALFKDNKGFDLSCTPNAFARGDASGVGRMFCPGFDKSPDPFPGKRDDGP
jgi:hypothetical protein